MGKEHKTIAMRFAVKLLIAVGVIIFCTQVGRKLPALAGLIAAMPLTTLIVLVWLYADNPSDFNLMTDYCRGILWGFVPSVLFFIVAFFCFRRHLPLGIVLAASFATWLIAAIIHQLLLNK